MHDKRKILKKTIKNIAATFGIRSAYDEQRHRLYLSLKERIELAEKDATELKKGSSCLIVFSKDRAMQLEALLRSFFFYVTHPGSVKVLFAASSPEHEKGYQKLIDQYTDRVSFAKETNFRSDLIKLFDSVEEEKVLFMVDDIFFKSAVDFSDFEKIDPKHEVLSLRLGNHLSYAYTLQKEQPLPRFYETNGNSTLLSWRWKEGKYDWEYPLSVDGHLFNTYELKILVNELEYKAPNSFESALQVMDPLFLTRKGLCYSQSIIVNNPCNKVQEENDNIHGTVSIEELNDKWLSGYRIDFESYKGLKNKSAHEDLPLKFIKE